MQIPNIRIGFATNSSSLHSIVILKDEYKNKKIKNLLPYYGYGWDKFILSSKDLKLDYMAQQILHNIKTYSPELRELIFKHYFNIDRIPEEISIDHQSLLKFPKYYSYEDINWSFLKEFLAYILRDDVLILGGNDNEEIDYGDIEKYIDGDIVDSIINRNGVNFLYLRGLFYLNSSHAIARKEHRNNYWTIFNRDNGLKIQLAFDKENKTFIPDTPELVDIKITNFCTKDCPFCYQDSHGEGQHANYFDVTSVLHSLNKLEVFEVAIGGGEPTEHPKFKHILQYINQCTNITPNFSTASLEWLDKDPEILDLIGSFGFSCTSLEELEKFNKYVEKYNLYAKAVLHIPLGTVDKETLLNLLKEREVYRVLLLGYKNVGRGNNFKYKEYDWWIDVVLESKIFQIGVDAVLVNQYSKQLERISDKIYFVDGEGTRSMYIDAVEMTMSPSSYDIKDSSPFPSKSENRPLEIKEIFHKFQNQYV